MAERFGVLRPVKPVVMSLAVQAELAPDPRVAGPFEVLARHLFHRFLHSELATSDDESKWLMQIAHEMEMFEMCIDRANERLEILQGRMDPEREVQRERYLRLMAGLAKASNDAADLGLSRNYFDFGGETAEVDENGLRDRWESELGNMAASELRSLAGPVH